MRTFHNNHDLVCKYITLDIKETEGESSTDADTLAWRGWGSLHSNILGHSWWLGIHPRRREQAEGRNAGISIACLKIQTVSSVLYIFLMFSVYYNSEITLFFLLACPDIELLLLIIFFIFLLLQPVLPHRDWRYRYLIFVISAGGEKV